MKPKLFTHSPIYLFNIKQNNPRSPQCYKKQQSIKSAFNNSFIKKLSQYLHDCVREEVKSSTFRNLKGDKDNKWIFLQGDEELFTQGKDYISLDGKAQQIYEFMLSKRILAQRQIFEFYGIFIFGWKKQQIKTPERIFNPASYMPCKLERNGVNINCLPLG